uniref:Uncharacterized protein n=1 Tax=Siphoviridae sp. ct0qt9 TaxID=2825298 RepID=A0A8S5P0V5_9CAUD|nr:MAG TPA: hypothetical protein [Siphoviridae sp. ct0qt9]
MINSLKPIINLFQIFKEHRDVCLCVSRFDGCIMYL